MSKVKIKLPEPTEEELRVGNKVDYLTRILSSDIYYKQHIPISRLTKEAIIMYNSCIIHEFDK